MNFSKVVMILRATSNSGKSTFAEYINVICEDNAYICCADDYFTDTAGNYNFDPRKLSEAHKACQDKFSKYISQNIQLIIVANTNTKESDFKFYEDKAKENGYMVFSIVIERRHTGKNNHNVPEYVLKNQEENIKNSLKLL